MHSFMSCPQLCSCVRTLIWAGKCTRQKYSFPWRIWTSGKLGPRASAPQTASRSVQPFLHSPTLSVCLCLFCAKKNAESIGHRDAVKFYECFLLFECFLANPLAAESGDKSALRPFCQITLAVGSKRILRILTYFIMWTNFTFHMHTLLI